MVSAVSAAMAVMVVEAGVAGRDASRHRAPAARCSKFCDCMVKEAEGVNQAIPGGLQGRFSGQAAKALRARGRDGPWVNIPETVRGHSVSAAPCVAPWRRVESRLSYVTTIKFTHDSADVFVCYVIVSYTVCIWRSFAPSR